MAETAIVLGVVAVVLGGLWGVIRTVRHNQSVTETVARIEQTVIGVRNFMKNAAALPAGDFTSLLIERSILPSDMVANPNVAIGTFQARHVWGGRFRIERFNNFVFAVELQALDQRSCFAVANKLAERIVGTASVSGDGVRELLVNGTVFQALLAATPEAVQVACNQGNNNLVVARYNVRAL